jgi:hypothetical protein
MNYAWANPQSGIREQTNQGTPERMLAEARRRAWLELQAIAIPANPVCESCHQTEGEFWYTPDGRYWCERHAGGHDSPAVHLTDFVGTTYPECQIWRQEPIGTVTVNGPHIDVEKALTFPPDNPWEFAWCDPVSGIRIVAENFPGAELVEQMKHLQNVMNDSKTDVIVYATWPECIVKRSDPEPPAPQDEPFRRFDEEREHLRRAGDSPDIDAQYTELESVIVLDDATKIAKVTAWAMLDIASVLREVAHDLRHPSPERRHYRMSRRNPSRSRRHHKGLWERFKLWLWGDPIEDPVTPPSAGAGQNGTCQRCGGPVEDPGDVLCTECAEDAVRRCREKKGACERCGGPTVGGLVICADCAKELLDRRIPTNYEQAVEMGWPIPPEESRSGGTPTDRQPGTMHGPVPVGVDPRKPHVFSYFVGGVTLASQDAFCSRCGLPQDDPIHGYTGD